MTFDPFQEVSNACVSTRNVFLSTVEAPRDKPGKEVGSIALRANQRRSTVVRARVNPRLAPKASKTLVKPEASAESVVLELPLTCLAIHEGKLRKFKFVGGL